MQLKTDTDFPPTVSVEEAGQLLGLSRSAAYRAVNRGELPAIELSGRLHVPTARLLELVGLTPEDLDEDTFA